MPYNISTSCIPSLSGISGTDCIGDTYSFLNSNFTNIANAVCNLSSTPITTSNTDTIQHTFSNRNLTSSVINESLSAIHLADNSVTTAKLSAQAVTTDKIALSAVTADRINLVTSLSTNGYQIMPSGLIMQWGKIDTINFNETNQGPYTFPVSFPNNCLNIVTTIIYNTAIIGLWNANVNTVSLSSFRVFGDYDSGSGTAPIYWQAIGY